MDSRLSLNKNENSENVNKMKFDDTAENREKDPLGLLPSLRYAIE